jgi:hypothetical protein
VHDRAIVALEVKRGPADQADTEKQEGYVRAISNDPKFSQRSKSYVLLATTSDKDEINGFSVRRYPILCRNLRRLAASWISQEDLLPAALALAVTAAIETNLLRMSLRRDSFTPSTLSHLREFNERSAYE